MAVGTFGDEEVNHLRHNHRFVVLGAVIHDHFPLSGEGTEGESGRPNKRCRLFDERLLLAEQFCLFCRVHFVEQWPQKRTGCRLGLFV